MKYTFKCPACEYVISVEADNDGAAVDMIMEQGKAHGAEAHPDMSTPEEAMREMVRNGMQKEE